MGKTDKEKAKEKEKSKAKALKKDKVPKALRPGGAAPKKKKWSKSKQKEKINNAVFWTKPAHDKFVKDLVGKETYITPSIVSDKLKVNMSMAREAIREMLDTQQLKPYTEYNSKYCCFVKGEKFVAHVEEKKAPKAQEKKQEKKPKEKKPK